MKKQLYKKLIAFAPLSLVALLGLTSCNNASSGNEKVVLRVLNAADYIYESGDISEEELECNYSQYLSDDDMLDQFVSYMEETKGVSISVVYDTYDTNETMYNQMKTGKSSYDVIVASDYMVQKLISQDLIQPFPEGDAFDSIRDNISPYLWSFFDNIHPKDPNTDELLADKVLSSYSAPYMWGTVGIMYNPEFYANLELDDCLELFSSWEALYSEEAHNSFSIKDSVRDTYAVSIVHAFYESEIAPLEEKLKNGEITEDQFNDLLNSIFNRCDDATLEIVKEDMLKLKDNSFGFEVDSGKTDMIEGKIGANVAWSGDATWAITEAEAEYEKELYFSIPKEGSNIWFDAFCIPKTSKHLEYATDFIDFMSKPENAIQNMWYVGYTTATSSIEVLDYIYECYDVRGSVGAELKEGTEYVEYDLSYFFDGVTSNPSDCVLYAYPETIGRTLTAQFPKQEDLSHLCVMDDFGLQNKAVLDMWEKVRTNSLPVWAIIILFVDLLTVGGFFIYLYVSKSYKRKMIKARRLERNK